MKKTSLLLMCLISAGAVFGQSQRLVFIEEFTNASCGPCASANPGFHTLMTNNATKATSLKYQVTWPGTDPMNAQNKPDVANRVTYYGVNGVPSFHTEGGAGSSATQTKINTAYAVPSPFSVKLVHWFNAANDSVFISCEITCTQAVTLTTPKIRVALTEKTITFTSAPGSNGEKVFHDVMRKMYPGPTGTAMATTWTVGQKQTLNFKEKLPTYIYKKSELAVVAWIQDDTGRKVQQTAFSPTPSGVSVNDINSVDNTLSVYPNPSNGIFRTTFEAHATDNYSVKITNAIGQVVFEDALNGFSGTYSRDVNVSSFGQGMYMLRISSSKGEEVKKLITY